MSISIDLLLKHMTWANQGVYKEISNLPNEALDAFVTNPKWTVREILHHVATISGVLGYRISGVKKDTLIAPESMKELREMTGRLLQSDQFLIELAAAQDGEVEIIRKGVTQIWQRSTIISQAIHHATEHRAQAVTALETKGYSSVNLDSFDLWVYQANSA